MKNDELPHAGGFSDDKISKYLRELIGDVPDNWRAHYFQITSKGVLVKGALARAKTDGDRKGRSDKDWICYRPYREQRQRVISIQKYGELQG